MSHPRFLKEGETGMVVEFGDRIDPALVAQVRSLQNALQQESIAAIRETVPTYRSLLIAYDPLQMHFDELKLQVERLLQHVTIDTTAAEVVEIPVCYGGSFGPDLQDVAEHAGVSEEKVIELHSSVDYLIYMLGFTPGFPYLGGLPKEIACPRLSSPRTAVPIGSVGIAETQTGVYPLETPGGWRLIGRTPLKLFDPKLEQPVLLKAGDYLRFKPISLADYERIQQQVLQNSYQVKRHRKEGGRSV